MNASSDNAMPQVDLVIAIDTSVSMKDEAVGLSEAATAAIEAAKSSCPADLQVTWLGVEGTWDHTPFNRTIRQYLTQACGVAEADIRGRKRGTVQGGGAQEDGARAIEDIASHFHWRSGAKRAVFYLSDEGIEGGGNDVKQADIEAANRAIATAKACETTVHTYFGTTRSPHREKLQQEFARVAHETGGQAFTHEDSIDGFAQVLEKIICATRNKAGDEPATAEAADASSAGAASATAASSTASETRASEAATATSSTGSNGDATHRIVRNHALVAAGISLIPLPLVDIAAAGVTQLIMVRKLSDVYGLPFSRHRAKAFIAALIGAAQTGLILTSMGQFIPGIGTAGATVTTVATEGVLTYAIGKVFVRHFDMGGTFLDLDANAMKNYFAEQCKEGRLVLRS